MKFRVYKDNAGEFHWSLVALNNRIIATSGEGYHNRADAMRMIAKIIDLDVDSIVIELGPQTLADEPAPMGG
jgi:uncharacterized protein